MSKIYKLGYHFYSVSLKQYKQHLDKNKLCSETQGCSLLGARASRLSSGGSSSMGEGMVGIVPHVSVRK